MAYLPSASYSLTLRLEIPSVPGGFGRVAAAIGSAGGDLGAIDLVRVTSTHTVRDVTVAANDAAHGQLIVDAVRALPGVNLVNVSDRTFLMHIGGKIEVANKVPVKTRDDLSMAYTPGVARVCTAIEEDPGKVWTLTIKHNSVAVVSDGTAVLGLGAIGPEAALPVMEGKAMLFKEFAGIDAWPLCLDTTDVDAIVDAVRAVAPGFGGINLEDISAPRCFAIEQRLREALDIPVFHDDQHGTAVVVLGALINAARLVGKPLEDLRIVVVGLGAAGVAVTRILLEAGVRDIVGCDREGAVVAGDASLVGVRRWYAEHTNPRRCGGALADVLRGADVFIGLSGPRVVSAEAIASMASDAIVFALANPEPEIRPELIQGIARVVATGRSDFPNQINNVLCFPGIFRGALDVRATEINEDMKVAAAAAIAGVISPDELHEDYIVPSVFNRAVSESVASAVADAAIRSGAARKTSRTPLEPPAIYG